MPQSLNEFRSGKLSPVMLASLIANGVLVIAVGYLIFGRSANISSGNWGSGRGTPDKAPAGAVESFGRIQPAGGLIAVYGPPGDKISKFDVNVGDNVSPKVSLVKLAGEVERKLAVDTLDAQIRDNQRLKESIESSLKTKLADIDNEAKQALVVVDNDLVSLEAKLKLIDIEKRRADGIFRRLGEAKAEGVRVSAEEIEQAESLVAKADAEYALALATKAKLDSQKKQAEENLRSKKETATAECNRALAQIPTDSLEASKKLAQQRFEDGKIQATTTGKVVRLLAKPGDTISTLPIMQIANTNRLSVLAEVYETDVGRLREWLRKGPILVEVDARALGSGSDGKPLVLRGSLASENKISTMIAKNALTPLGPREDADRRVVEVEVDLDSASTAAADKFLGLQVRVRFEPPK